MDLHYSDRTIHLPQEILAGIASHLRKAEDIRAARLVNQALCDAATALMMDLKRSPSAMFTRPTDEEIAEIEKVRQNDPQFFNFFWRQSKETFTIWTWIEVPRDVRLEDRHRPQGRSFLERVIAPATEDVLMSLDDDEDQADGKDDVPMHSGRKAVCWGRIQEKPDLFCIVTQWHTRVHWNAYRFGDEARALVQFLEEVAPGCVASSASEEVPFPPELKNRRPLFNSYSEIRTVYFKASMRTEQKKALEATQHVRHFSATRYRCAGSYGPGRSFACWLRGFRKVDSQTAVAARLVFPHDSEAYLRRQQEATSENGNSLKSHAELLDGELQLAGMLKSEQLHCDFHVGPGWRN